jgi:tetratricopeptide (TPR) repeat protein
MAKKSKKINKQSKRAKRIINSAELFLNTAIEHVQRNEKQEAVQTINNALRYYPNDYRFSFLLGKILLSAQNFIDAALALEIASKLAPENHEVHFYVARCHEFQNRLDKAVLHYAKAIELKPDFFEALTNLGGLSLRLGRTDYAQEYVSRALNHREDSANLWVTMGNVRQAQGRFPEAVSCYRKAHEIDPGDPRARYNMSRFQPLQESLEQTRRVIADDPSLGEPHYHLAIGLLSTGQLSDGWREYEWRFKKEQKPVTRRPFSLPWWQGEPLPEKSLLIWAEQGLGDEILFAGAFDDALKIAPQGVIECEPRLVSLFSRSFIGAQIVPRTHPVQAVTMLPSLQYQCAAGSLMQWLRLELNAFKRQKYPYLIPNPERVDHWRRWLRSLGTQKKVGLCWRSMKPGVFRSMGYPSILECEHLFSDHEVQWVNLQYDNCAEELQMVKDKFGTEIIVPEGLDLMNDMDDQAALMRALDGVVSAGTATAQLAGAVGARLLMFGTGRPWTQLGTDYLPFYPGAKYLFRQSAEQPWQEFLQLSKIMHHLFEL